MDEEEVQARLLVEASKVGLDADQAEFLVAETMKRYSELIESTMPGAGELYSVQELNEVLTQAFKDVLSMLEEE